MTAGEAASLAAGLSRQGVDVGTLLAHIEAWPYQNVALDWISAPEFNVALLCRVIEQELAPMTWRARPAFASTAISSWPCPR